MADIEIRYATKDDCDALSKVVATVIQNIPYYNDLAKQSEIAKFQPHNLQTKVLDDNFSIIIATSKNTITGFCLTRFDDYVIWLEWFGVVESNRGEGIAHILLQELDKTVLPRGCHKIWCDCRTSNSAAIHVLTHHGYNQLITIPNHWYKQDFILWQKLF